MLEHELSDHGHEDTDDDDDNNISASISDYRESENRIAQLEAYMDDRYGTRVRRNLRSRRVRDTVPSKFAGMEADNTEDIEAQLNAMSHQPLSLKYYANIYAEIHHNRIADADNYLKNEMVSTILTQYHVSKGLKIFGEKGVDAVLKELRQLHYRMVIEPKFADSMTEKQKDDTLQYLMFLKEKRAGVIKGRGCAEGRNNVSTYLRMRLVRQLCQQKHFYCPV